MSTLGLHPCPGARHVTVAEADVARLPCPGHKRAPRPRSKDPPCRFQSFLSCASSGAVVESTVRNRQTGTPIIRVSSPAIRVPSPVELYPTRDLRVGWPLKARCPLPRFFLPNSHSCTCPVQVQCANCRGGAAWRSRERKFISEGAGRMWGPRRGRKRNWGPHDACMPLDG